MTFIDGTTGTSVGASGTILRTTDGGSTWGNQNSGTTSQLNEVVFTDANTGTAVGEGGTILRTTDGGNEWNDQVSGTTNLLFGLSFVDTNTGAAVGAESTILKTTDGGVIGNLKRATQQIFFSEFHLLMLTPELPLDLAGRS